MLRNIRQKIMMTIRSNTHHVIQEKHQGTLHKSWTESLTRSIATTDTRCPGNASCTIGVENEKEKLTLETRNIEEMLRVSPCMR